MKKWKYEDISFKTNPDRFYVRYLSFCFQLDPVLMNYLYSKGYNTRRKIREFLYPSVEQLYDPFLLQDMGKTVHRILKAIKTREKIMIFGDYDCDGQTSTALLYRALVSLGAQVDFRVPLRSEGYGLRPTAMKQISSEDISLIITVDNGTSAHAALALATEMGIDVIVTDHHEILQGHPNCYAFINPKREDNLYPCNYLAGVGVALKVVQALLCKLFGQEWKLRICDFLDFAAIGTVADMMPLTGENRTIVALGIRMLNERPKQIFKKILQRMPDRQVNSTTIGFGIGPLLNACGRIANPNTSTRYLCEGDLTENDLLELININDHRKVMTKEHFDLAEVIIRDQSLDDYNVIVIEGPFHEGIIGLLASRITEKYAKPAIVINHDGKGSCRSVQDTNFSIIKAIEECSSLLNNYGGHRAAAGLSIDTHKIDDFRKDIHFAAEHQEKVIPKVPFQKNIPLFSFPKELIKQFQRLEPFGMGNPKPVFYSESWFDSCIMVGHTKEHFLLTVAKQKMWAFRFGDRKIKSKKKTKFLYTVNSTTKEDFLLIDIET